LKINSRLRSTRAGWLIIIPAAMMLLLFGFDVMTRGQTAGATGTTFSPATYRQNERLSYNVSFSNFDTAAHIELFVAGRGAIAGRDTFELRAHVETIGVVNAALYSLNNDYVSFVDPATGFPLRTQQSTRESGRTPDMARDYNQAVGSSALNGTTVAATSGMYDPLSALYALRALPLAQGATYPLTVQYNGREYRAELKVTGREVPKTNIGSSNAIVTQLRVKGDREINDMRVRIYFSDDASHVPVLLTAQLPSGEIRAEIASAEVLPESPVAPPIAAAPNNKPPPRPTPPDAFVNPEGNNRNNSLADLPFKVGEELNFNFLLGDAAQLIGKATFQVRSRARFFNQDGLLLAAALQTSGAGQTLFPVSDQISSYVDLKTLLPFRTELRLQEGKRRTNWTVKLGQELGSATFDDGARVPIPVGTHDILSVFYALRSFDLTPPKRNVVSLILNKRPRLLVVTALQRQTIELGGQRIPAVQVSLATDEAQGDRFGLRLWVSADSRRLPLRLTATTPLGPVRADLAILPVGFQ